VLEFLAARVFDGQVVLVSEYAPDGSLKDWLKLYSGRAPSVEAAIRMTRGILAGLEHLHGRNIIHRDIKPDNVLLQGATPRLADFGISRVLKTTSHTVQGAGTPTYMAPEAFKRKRNQQTDLWSVGVLLYQMLSGRLPFDGADITELYGAILNEEPDPLPAEIPEWLRQIVAKALTKDPEQRFKTAAEMRIALMPQPPTVKEVPVQPPRHTVTVDEPPPKRQPTIAEAQPKRQPTIVEPLPQPKPVPPGKLRPAIKWGTGIAAIVIVVATYLAIKTSTTISPNSFDSPGNTQPLPSSSPVSKLPNLGDEFTENLNGVNLVMKRVPGGEFLMGSPDNENGRSSNESPQHRVTVPSFYIGKTEVTQAQWKAVMGGKNPSNFKGDDLPVETISWNDAKEFCKKLSQMTGKTYRLPSEAEWEYACRAGTTGAYAGELDAMAWYSDNSGGKTHPVGRKQANRFGLFDMHGNVWEWCEDVWHDSYGGQHGNPPSDGSAWLTGGEQQYRVLRGGSWGDYSRYARSADRFRYGPGDRDFFDGVRVVLSSRTQ